MRRCKSINVNVNFTPEENDMDEFIQTIKDFGKINFNNFKFIECPEKISYSREYRVSGEDRNIITKTGENHEWMGTICENELDKSKEYIWKIKVLKSEDMKIMIGIAPKDFEIDSSMYNDCGWYYSLSDNSLYAEPKNDLKKGEKKGRKFDKKWDKKEEQKKERPKKEEKSKKEEKPKKEDSDEDMGLVDLFGDEKEIPNNINNIKEEITVIFNLEKKLLQFTRDNQIIGEFSDINIDRPLFPAIFIYNRNDTVEIEGFN